MEESTRAGTPADSFSPIIERYLLWSEAEQQVTPETVRKRRDCLRQVVRIIGEKSVSDFTKADLLTLKADLVRRNLSASRQYSILASLKYFLRYVEGEEGLATFPPDEITFPKRPRKQVVYLTPEEIERFLATIKLRNWHWPYGAYLLGVRFRAVVEAILGSGLRISEVLSLDRHQLDTQTHEVKIIGKGRKERTAFLTDRAFYWLETYLALRTDKHPAVFVTTNGRRRLVRTDIWRTFGRCRQLAGIVKPVTPHILRHTAATQLLFNGCPVNHIKEILGHSRLETTCRYYLGLDQRAAKAAHLKFLRYDSSPDEA